MSAESATGEDVGITCVILRRPLMPRRVMSRRCS